jgi:cyclopropane-fatty-acyl-phospholipid synthase
MELRVRRKRQEVGMRTTAVSTVESLSHTPEAILDLGRRHERLQAAGVDCSAFAVRIPDNRRYIIGPGEPSFQLTVTNQRGLDALASFDELRVGEACLEGDIELEGDLLKVFQHRVMLTDHHPLRSLLIHVIPLIVGRIRADRCWIESHYNNDPAFYATFLDKELRGYSHGLFEADDEPLEQGIRRKFEFAYHACNLQPGDRVLDVGGGWGSFVQYAGSCGARVTAIAIAREQVRYMQDLIQNCSLPCETLLRHFYEYRSSEPFDAIVNFGATEHLPDYRRSFEQYQRLLKPGGLLYVDALSAASHRMSTFTSKWLFAGTSTALVIHEFLAEAASQGFEVIRVIDDRHNYFLTCRKWAENLERAKDIVVQRWGQRLYRHFRLYLWASASSFQQRVLTAHRLVLRRT